MRSSSNSTAPESLYARLFARFYDRFMNRIETKILYLRRKELIAPLHGRILEIGSGTGINFPLYGSKANVIAIEPSVAMMEKAKERMANLLSSSSVHSKIRMEIGGLGNPETEALVPPSSMDAIVFTLVLCTVPDLEYAIRFARSRLKKGGKILLLEHVQAQSTAGRILQNILNPFWKKFAQGCNINRNPAVILKAEGLQPIREERFRHTLPFYQAIYELAE
ncbi:class I SAM-dependent methyltransferase [Leptospira yasudae]|uniref:Methyltransferase domain-containing protein n=1 Tax=Leptospira yasudae TaxID=2202201 RepID=A0A6N4QHQ4_9LEPT|nr:class I SAM-dependent methyltransferase [Leptospira yasudae]TGL77103.1 methyltransferase domain-containing protein [Leptospira yasudae]TGL80402.1 methyltransferase domain-containing protein [Leptospira yasudae]TGL85829.1 methyltransferase domain-containing protein [Leptospira yasudae]